jgi:hypothetical protein
LPANAHVSQCRHGGVLGNRSGKDAAVRAIEKSAGSEVERAKFRTLIQPGEKSFL